MNPNAVMMKHVRIYEPEHQLYRRLAVGGPYSTPSFTGDVLKFVDADGDETLADRDAMIEAAADDVGNTFHTPLQAVHTSRKRIEYLADSTPLPQPLYAKLALGAPGERDEALASPTTPGWSRRTLKSLDDLYPEGPPAEDTHEEYYYWDADVGGWCSLLSGSELAALSALKSSGTKPVFLVQGRHVMADDRRCGDAKLKLAALIEASRPLRSTDFVDRGVSAHCADGVTPGMDEESAAKVGRSAQSTGDVHVHGANVRQQMRGEVPHPGEVFPSPTPSAPSTMNGLGIPPSPLADPLVPVPSSTAPFLSPTVVEGAAHCEDDDDTGPADSLLVRVIGRPPFEDWVKNLVHAQVRTSGVGEATTAADVVYYIPTEKEGAFADAAAHTAILLLEDEGACEKKLTDAIVLLSAAAYFDRGDTMKDRLYSLACGYSRRSLTWPRGTEDQDDTELLHGRLLLWPREGDASVAAAAFGVATQDAERALACLAGALEAGFCDVSLAAQDPDLSPIRHLVEYRELMETLRSTPRRPEAVAEGVVMRGVPQHGDPSALPVPPSDSVTAPARSGDADGHAFDSDSEEDDDSAVPTGAPDPYAMLEQMAVTVASKSREHITALQDAWSARREAHGGSSSAAAKAAATEAAGAASARGAAALQEVSSELARAVEATRKSRDALKDTWREAHNTSASQQEAVMKTVQQVAKSTQNKLRTEFESLDASMRRDVEHARKGAKELEDATVRTVAFVKRLVAAMQEASQEAIAEAAAARGEDSPSQSQSPQYVTDAEAVAQAAAVPVAALVAAGRAFVSGLVTALSATAPGGESGSDSESESDREEVGGGAAAPAAGSPVRAPGAAPLGAASSPAGSAPPLTTAETPTTGDDDDGTESGMSVI